MTANNKGTRSKKPLISKMVRLNRKAAWILVLSSIITILTGYGQTMQVLDIRIMETLHLISKWVFIIILGYHVIVSTFLSRYKYGSSLRRIRKGKASLGIVLRFILRISSWPLLLASAIVVLSGLSWYGYPSLSFKLHLETDIALFILFTVHVAAGGVLAAKRNWPKNRPGTREASGQAARTQILSRRQFLRYGGGIITASVAAYSLVRLANSSQIIDIADSQTPETQNPTDTQTLENPNTQETQEPTISDSSQDALDPISPQIGPQINANLCRRCLRCVRVCPSGAIDNNLNIDTSKCIQCGTCETLCPANAISLS